MDSLVKIFENFTSLRKDINEKNEQRLTSMEKQQLIMKQQIDGIEQSISKLIYNMEDKNLLLLETQVNLTNLSNMGEDKIVMTLEMKNKSFNPLHLLRTKRNLLT